MILNELQEVLGPTQAQRFLNVFAGTDVQFPKRQDGPFFAELTRVVGAEAAGLLCRRFAGGQVYIPRNAADERERRDMEIAARMAAGESPDAIARSYRVVTRLSARTVRRIAERLRKALAA